MKIPSTASPEVQQAFREVWAAVDRLGGALNIDLQGRRITNAGPAVSGDDYATLDDLRQQIRAAVQQVEAAAPSATAASNTDFADALALLEDAGVVFDNTGALATDVANFSWRYTNGSLRLGPAIDLRWHHGAELRSATAGVLEISGEDHDVSASLARIALGLDNNGRPALVPNPPGLDIRRGGPGGALTDLACATLSAGTSVLAATSVVAAADPGGADPLRVGGNGFINGHLTIRDTTLIHTNLAFNNGAGGGAGTLNNAPAGGDPTKWVPIDDGGTTRYIPAW